MRRYLIEYVAMLVLMLAMDSVWLNLTAATLYKPILGDLLRPEPDLVAAVLFYLVYVAGAVYFAVMPVRDRSPWLALPQGALFGAVAYATYDLTNQATLRSWSTVITLADISWGAILTALAATGASLISLRLHPARALA